MREQDRPTTGPEASVGFDPNTEAVECRVTIGILGAGAMAQALAQRFVAGGFAVLLSNRRGPDSLHEIVALLGPGVTAATLDEAAMQRVVIIAIPWSQLPAVLGRVSNWDGQIVIDTTNPIEPPHFTVAELRGRTSSEVVADLVPGARLIKAFNTLTPSMIARDPREAGGHRVIFFCGNDTDARNDVNAMLASCGFAGVDLGDLATGGTLMQFPGGPLPALNLIRLG
jgi:predicted dinucleotide-binding enzyme